MLTTMGETLGPGNYVEFFQEPGVAEAVLEADARATMRSTLIGAPRDPADPPTAAGAGDGDGMVAVADHVALPGVADGRDVELFARTSATGFHGRPQLNRGARPTVSSCGVHGSPLLPPSLFACGDRRPRVPVAGHGRNERRDPADRVPSLTTGGPVKGSVTGSTGRPDDVNDLLPILLTAAGLTTQLR